MAAGGFTSSLSYLCSFSLLQGLVGGNASQRTPKTEHPRPSCVLDSPQQSSSYTKSAATDPSSTLHFAPRSSRYERRLLQPRQHGSCSDADIILPEGHGETSARQHGNVVSVRRHDYQDAFVEYQTTIQDIKSTSLVLHVFRISYSNSHNPHTWWYHFNPIQI